MKTILCRICWSKKYNGTGDLQCVNMDFDYEYGGETWNFSPCDDGIIRGYVMLSATDSTGQFTGTIDINKLGANTKDKFIEGINIIFFAANPKDKTNYVVGWYENAKVYRNWVGYPILNNEPWEDRTYSFECNTWNAYLIPEYKRHVKVITARSKEAIERGGSFPGMSGVFFGKSNEEYTTELLETIKHEQLKNELEEIKEKTEIGTTEKQQLVSARIGQGFFRQQLINLWGCCAVTGCDDISLLRASHIKPWRASSDEERLNKYNGVLLSPTLDALFDKGLISFENNGKIIISESLSNENMERLGIHFKMQISTIKKHHSFLKWHRDNILK